MNLKENFRAKFYELAIKRSESLDFLYGSKDYLTDVFKSDRVKRLEIFVNYIEDQSHFGHVIKTSKLIKKYEEYLGGTICDLDKYEVVKAILVFLGYRLITFRPLHYNYYGLNKIMFRDGDDSFICMKSRYSLSTQATKLRLIDKIESNKKVK